MAKTKIYIDKDLVLRWHPNWPVEPPPGIPSEMAFYNQRLAQAKAESIILDTVEVVKSITKTTTTTLDEADQFVRFNYNADTFIEITGEVEVVEQFKRGDGSWVDFYGPINAYAETRKVARLKSAMNPLDQVYNQNDFPAQRGAQFYRRHGHRRSSIYVHEEI